MKILVLDGHVNPAVAAVRSLSRAGQRVVVGSPDSWSKAGWSRYSSGSFRYSSVEKDVKRFAAEIATEASREDGTFIFPCSEKTVMALSAHRALIEEAGASLVMPSHATMLKAYNKAHTTKIAGEVGVACPRTCRLHGEASALSIASSFPYPAALKCCTSVELVNGSVNGTPRTLYARDPQEFMEAYRQLSSRSSHVIAQEFIPGEGFVYCLLLCRGELRAEFAYRRIRSVHPTGWGACVRVSVPAGDLRDGSLRIIRTLDPAWTGLAAVEYRVRNDGTPFFLEVNPRTWNSMSLAVYAGVDFPRMVAEIAEYGDVRCHRGYPAGVVCRWWLGDLHRLLYVWRGASGSYPGKIPGRLAALGQFLKPVPHAFHDNFMLADPLPAIGDWLAAAVRTMRRTFARIISWFQTKLSS